MTEMNEQQQQQQQELLSHYLLHRIGHITDELEWPNSTSKAESWTKKRAAVVAPSSSTKNINIGNSNSNNNSIISRGSGNGAGRALETHAEVAGSAWRVRDAMSLIFGDGDSILETTADGNTTNLGLLTAPPAPAPADPAASTTGEATSTATSLSTSVVPISSILSRLLPSPQDLYLHDSDEDDDIDDDSSSSEEDEYDDDDNENDDENEGDGNDYGKKPLNIKHVKRAFHAAAYSIIRGNKRALAAAFADADGNHGHGIASTAKDQQWQRQHQPYEPPFIQAMESIRVARMTSLNEASGKSVPAFLKKNNTIPWFHLPPPTGTITSAATNGTFTAGGGVGGTFASSTVGSSSLTVPHHEGVSGNDKGDSNMDKKIPSSLNNDKQIMDNKEHQEADDDDDNDDHQNDSKNNNEKKETIVKSEKRGGSSITSDHNSSKRIKLEQQQSDDDNHSETANDNDNDNNDKEFESPSKPKKRVKEENNDDDGDGDDDDDDEDNDDNDTAPNTPTSHCHSAKTTPTATTTTTATPATHPPKTKTACIAGGPCSSLLPAAHIDNRATVARAILCAAAAVVFRELTPDFNTERDGGNDGGRDGDEKEDERNNGCGGVKMEVEENDYPNEEEFVPESTKSSNTAATIPLEKKEWDIDLLEVPQNGKEGTDDEDDDVHDKNSNNDDDNDNDDNASRDGNISQSTDGSVAATDKPKKKPPLKVNMGAVMVQAKTLGNRVLDHAKGAARRSDRRREFRMDSALSRVGRGLVRLNDGGMGSRCSSGMLTLGNEEGGTSSNSFLVTPAHSLPLVIPNPFAMMDSDEEDVKATGTDAEDDDSEDMDSDDQLYNSLTAGPAPRKKDDPEWTNSCLPRMLAILRTGSGHAILHDMEWSDRQLRVAELLYNLATPQTNSTSIGNKGNEFLEWQDLRKAGRSSPSSIRGYPNYGPHLIVTATGQDFDRFAAVFGQLGHGLRVVCKEGEGARAGSSTYSHEAFPTNPDDVVLRVLAYNGSKSRRRRLRKHFGSLSPSPDSPFCFLGGLPDSPYHVVLTTYSAFVEDYVHFCQIPFQAVVMDDGMSWLGCANYDPNGKLGKVWDSGIWSNSDNGAGMGGVGIGGQYSSWDFSKEDGGIEADQKRKSAESSLTANKKDGGGSAVDGNTRGKLLIGLTARHRILLASSMHTEYRGQVYKAPVPGLLSFLTPQFTEVVRDEWERSRVYNCNQSMAYMRKLIVRSVVVYSGNSSVRGKDDSFTLALKSMNGEILPSRTMSDDSFDEEAGNLLSSNKIAQSRKFAAAWFKPLSSAGNELGSISFEPILSAVKTFNASGYVCEEIVTASSLTTSGAGGMVAGPSAYRSAVRCGRSFGSEQGLRQHIAALHAPPGTWLCRSCGGDCFTSQARTHHERTCGVTEGGIPGSLGGGVPTVGQGIGSSKGTKQKQAKNLAAAGIQPDKDEDGSFRVPGYKGVWVKPNGKHFVKIDGESIMDGTMDTNDSPHKGSPLLFDTAEEAAKKFDETITDKGKAQDTEMNFKSDGSRIVYEDSAGGAAVGRNVEMLGGGASSVVPALSVINIKDLPKNVKPLLRDPKQTSRTGGNSKRYVYAYRGVCRQARKGHDRWQSQISFNGTNHYLGTFDSEWDAAAVYAWAHLILYGDEATRKAQREGEEAAAAYEQEKKDIADGKIPPPAPKPAKKKKKPGAPKKENKTMESGVKKATPNEGNSAASTNSVLAKQVDSPMQSGKKKAPVTVKEWSTLKTECAMMLSSGTKGTSKATILATRKDIAETSDEKLLGNIPGRISAGSKPFLQSISAFRKCFQSLPACVSLTKFAPSILPQNCSVLIGLNGQDFSWEVEKFISRCQEAGPAYASTNTSKLTSEYGEGGMNESFRTIILSSSCVLGRAPKEWETVFSSVGINNTVGMSVGNLECNVGGPEHSCSKMAAKVEYLPTTFGKYQFMACNDDDIVTLNGRRIIASMGPFPLRNRDICSVGPRVFVFIHKYRSK